jgi:predicted ester cyclase
MHHDNAALSRRWFKEVWNENREQTIDELASPDVVIYGLGEDGGEAGVGIESFKKFFRLFRAGLSDIHTDVHDVIAEGDQTSTRITMTATHTGPGFGVAPTGRPVKMTAIVWCRWRDGRIVEGWNEFDAAGLMKQIGAAGGTAAAVKAK